MGNNSSLGQSSFTTSNSNSYSQTGQDTQTIRDYATTSSSLYQAGSFAGGSLSLSSFNFSMTATDSFNEQHFSHFTATGGEQASANGTAAAINTFATNASNQVNQNASSQTLSITDTFNRDVDQVVTLNSRTTLTLSEQGTYGSYGYNLGSIVYRVLESGNQTILQDAVATVNGNVLNNSNTSFTSTATTTGLDTTTSQSSGGTVSNNNDTFSKFDSITNDIYSTASYTLYQGGNYSGGSFAFASITYDLFSVNTASSQETTSAAETLTQTGSFTVNPITSASTVSVGSTTVSSAAGANITAVSYTNTFTNSPTILANQSSVGYFTLHEEGKFQNGSFSLSKVIYDGVGNQAINETVYQNQASTRTSLKITNLSSSYSGQSLGFTNQSTGTISTTMSEMVTGTANLSGTQNWSNHEEGSFAAASFALSCFLYQEQATAYQSSTLQTTDTVISTAYTQGTFTLAGFTNFLGNLTVSTTDVANDSVSANQTSSFALYQAGSVTYGIGFGLSSYSLSASQSRSSVDSQSASGTMTTNGVNTANGGNVTFSGTGQNNFNSLTTLTQSGSIAVAGTASQGFNATSFSFSDQANNCFSLSKTSSEAWTGGYSGTDGFTAAASGSGSYSESGAGCYSAGTLSLSTYAYSSSAGGLFNSTESGAAGTMTFAQTVTLTESNQAAMAGTYQVSNLVGNFSFTNYQTSFSRDELRTSKVNGQSDSLEVIRTGQLTGSGQTGTQTNTTRVIYNGQTSIQTVTATATLVGHAIDVPDIQRSTIPLAANIAPTSYPRTFAAAMGVPVALGLGGGLELPAPLLTPPAVFQAPVSLFPVLSGIGFLGPLPNGGGWVGPGGLAKGGPWDWIATTSGAAWGLFNTSYRDVLSRGVHSGRAFDPLGTLITEANKTWLDRVIEYANNYADKLFTIALYVGEKVGTILLEVGGILLNTLVSHSVIGQITAAIEKFSADQEHIANAVAQFERGDYLGMTRELIRLDPILNGLSSGVEQTGDTIEKLANRDFEGAVLGQLVYTTAAVRGLLPELDRYVQDKISRLITGQSVDQLLNGIDAGAAARGRAFTPVLELAIMIATMGAGGGARRVAHVPRRGMRPRLVFDAQGRPVIGPSGRQVVIYGTPQNTTGRPNNPHARVVEREALRLARTGRYDYIMLNRSWRTALGRAFTTTGLRPDIIGVRLTNGGFSARVWAWEVGPMRQQRILLDRARAGGATIASPIVVLPPGFFPLP